MEHNTILSFIQPRSHRRYQETPYGILKSIHDVNSKKKNTINFT